MKAPLTPTFNGDCVSDQRNVPRAKRVVKKRVLGEQESTCVEYSPSQNDGSPNLLVMLVTLAVPTVGLALALLLSGLFPDATPGPLLVLAALRPVMLPILLLLLLAPEVGAKALCTTLHPAGCVGCPCVRANRNTVRICAAPTCRRAMIVVEKVFLGGRRDVGDGVATQQQQQQQCNNGQIGGSRRQSGSTMTAKHEKWHVPLVQKRTTSTL